MKINFGFLISKFLRWLNRPALRNCNVHKTANIGSGSNCINVTMGRYSYIGKNNSIICTNIGSFCSIASYCAIGGSGHISTMVSTSPIFLEGRNVFHKNFAQFKLPNTKLVTIGHDVWIGEGVFIKEGVTIGHGAIIGAHSVVTKDIPPYMIVAGAPAKCIRYRFLENEINRLLKEQWWNWSDEKLIENSVMFESIGNFCRCSSKLLPREKGTDGMMHHKSQG